MTAFQYAAKFICGRPSAGELAPGVYFTAINVHNPTGQRVRFEFTKKFAIAWREGERPGPVSDAVVARLPPNAAFEIDCVDIRKKVPLELQDAPFLKGFVIIESEVDLDVVTVYTAASDDGEVRTLDVERVRPRGT